ncbi:MAG: hypothetical protein LC118_11340 [Dehalococcoidia bacterium]|nr:hypothetical protein [Dehalococcoidia bacterium]
MILLLVPPGFDVPSSLWERCAVITCATTEAALAALAMPRDGLVIVTDALPPADLPRVAEAIRSSPKPAIEVRSQRWDGDAFSPVSAACQGVISGFGPNGLRAAAGLLMIEATP